MRSQRQNLKAPPEFVLHKKLQRLVIILFCFHSVHFYLTFFSHSWPYLFLIPFYHRNYRPAIRSLHKLMNGIKNGTDLTEMTRKELKEGFNGLQCILACFSYKIEKKLALQRGGHRQKGSTVRAKSPGKKADMHRPYVSQQEQHSSLTVGKLLERYCG